MYHCDMLRFLPLLACSALSCFHDVDRPMDFGAVDFRAADFRAPDAAPMDQSQESEPADISVDQPHTYKWTTATWRSCDKKCGGGTQTRVVRCEREDKAVVNDSNCSGAKPATSQACNKQSCVLYDKVNCPNCPFGFSEKGGLCNNKLACTLKSGQLGRYYYSGAWHSGCAICNIGGGIRWQIYQLP